jgi:Tfp pilus assembly protein PilF
LRLLGRKVFLFWGSTEIKNNEDPGYFRNTMISLRWLPVSFALLAPPALIGLGLGFHLGRRWRLLAGFILLWFASVVAFFVCARYRLPLAPLLAIPAVLFAQRMGEWVRRRRWIPAGAALLILAVLYPGLAADPAQVRAGGYFQSYCNLGDALSESGDWSRAEPAYRIAIGLAPLYPNSYINLAQALQQLHRTAEAEAVLRQGLAAVPGHPQMRKNLALVLQAEGRLEESASLLQGLIGEYPQAWDSCMFLGRVREQQGNNADALGSYRRAVEIAPQSVQPRLHLARLQAAAGDTASALATIEAGLRYEPQSPDLRRVQSFLREARGLRN